MKVTLTLPVTCYVTVDCDRREVSEVRFMPPLFDLNPFDVFDSADPWAEIGAGDAVAVRMRLYADPDDFIARIRNSGTMKIEVLTVDPPVVEIRGLAGNVIDMLMDAGPCVNLEEATSCITATAEAIALEVAKDTVWPPLQGLPDTVIWEA